MKYSIWKDYRSGHFEVCMWQNRQPVILKRFKTREAAEAYKYGLEFEQCTSS